jgi:hypothetical protein
MKTPNRQDNFQQLSNLKIDHPTVATIRPIITSNHPLNGCVDAILSSRQELNLLPKPFTTTLESAWDH